MANAVLFATDIAARGLDFPAVDWVIQLDCPEDADTYIHRVGRTARFDAAGQALLFLLPSEKEAMQAELAKKKVPVEEVKIRASKQQSIQNQLQSFCFQDPEIKYLGQKVMYLGLEPSVQSNGIFIIFNRLLLHTCVLSTCKRTKIFSRFTIFQLKSMHNLLVFLVLQRSSL
jgi:superfamily II DNA/RNA helicase